MNADSNQQFLIGRLAKLAGVKSDTIRFYERCGLLPKPERKASGYRVYDEAALKLVRFIKRAQALGFSLDEIRRILSLRGGGKKTCDHVLAIAEATLEETERRLAELQAFRNVLKQNVATWKKSKQRACAAEFCALIESASSGANARRPSMLS